MNVEITNVIKVNNYTQDIFLWCENNLVLDNPTFLTLKRLGKDDTIKRTHVPEKIKNYVRRGSSLEIPFGCLYAVWGFIKDCEIKTNFNSHNPISIANIPSAIELFDYQAPAVQFMINAKGGVLNSPCGSGKTIMGIEIVKRIGKRFLWLCHTTDLLNQAYNDFKNLYPNVDIGLTTEGKVHFGKDGTISTVQTMSKLSVDLYREEFDVVVVDECAHCVGTPTNLKMFGSVLNSIKARYKYGLTATPSRSDSMIESMYALLGVSKKGSFEPTYKIDKSQVKTMPAIHQKFDLYTDVDFDSEVYDTDGTLNYAGLINFLSYNEKRDKIIIDNIVKCSQQGRKQVALCLRVDHVEKICADLCKLGVKAVCVSSKTSKKQRKQILLEQTNDWDVLVATYSLLKEGINIKELDTLHLIVPQKDKALIVQSVGRIERFLEGKKQPIAYDYVDVTIPYCVGAYKKRKTNIKKRY